MLIYTSTKSKFRNDVKLNRIESVIHSAFQRNLGRKTGAKEIASWKNSMQYMSNVLEDTGIPENAGVAIEYMIPPTSRRIDFILTGRDHDGQGAAIIIELKQWSEASLTEKDGIVKTYMGGGELETSHPSYQAWTYAALLEDFNEAVHESPITVSPCAYLHNMNSDNVIRDPRYSEHLNRAPAFLRPDVGKLADFIKQFIHHGDEREVLFEIAKGKIRPSKNLADHVLSMLKGNEEFYMIDDQKLVFETAMGLANRSTPKKKNVLIVEGGPGTGKSVVAINLLVRLTEERHTTQYVTKNAAPRAVYESVLTGSFKKSRITNLFTGSGSYTSCEPSTFDALIVDEAHRLNAKSGMYQNLGENQVKEIIQASNCSVFFLDEDQRVTWKDLGSVDEIEMWAGKAGAKIHRLELQSQFRCNGSDGFLAWLDNVLQIRETANTDIGDVNYDIRIFDSPTDLMSGIAELNSERNKARVVAGYCWDWISKKKGQGEEFDIIIEEHNFAKRWNLQKDGSLWIQKPDSVNEVGCIHTCQGLEVDYIGVIIGPDLVVRDGEVIVRPEFRSRMDSTLKGYKKELKKDPDTANEKAERIIKNTYRTLMSRGQKGCYIYCTDKETAEYFALMLQGVQEESIQTSSAHTDSSLGQLPDLSLRILPVEEVRPFENCVPIFDLAVAAGGFQPSTADECSWVELPGAFLPQLGLFIVQIVGESMNKKIPNNSWCLFQANPGGTRNNKIVIVQHRDIHDPDTGAKFTVKRYHSEKSADGDTWKHKRIVLSPESTDSKYSDIVLEDISDEGLRIVGEFVAVIG